MDVKHTELPCFYDDRDKGWGGENNRLLSHTKSK